MLKSLAFFFIIIFFGMRVLNAQINSIKINMGQFTYNYENDFFTATDRYYTQGIKPELIHPSLGKIPTTKLLLKLKKASQTLYGINATQLCFTPRSIRYDTIKVGERPFSANIFVSQFLISNNKTLNERIISKLDVGMMGPCAVCEPEQKGIHKALKNIQPLGWEYQLKNHVILNYTVGFEKGIIMQRNMEFVALSQMRFGTLWNDIGIGTLFRFGKINQYFSSYGLISQEKRRFQSYFYVKGMTNLIGYNASLQGGLFNHNDIYSLPAAAITRVVGTLNSGLVIAFHKFSMEYSLYWISPEFTNGLFHAWGRCGLSFGF